MTRPRSVLALAALVLSCLAALPSAAAVYVPTKTADTADGACDADCSLREAVIAANLHPGDDVILLHEGTYLLSIVGDDATAAAGDLDVTGNLTLIGDGPAETVVDAGGVDRIFEVLGGAVFELTDVTLRNGHSANGGGGAAAVDGELTLARAYVHGNTGGACGTFCEGGGAILVRPQGSFTARDSTFTDNTAAAVGGGAIFAAGNLDLSNVTVSLNHTGGSGSGGGLYVASTSTAHITSSTIASNDSTRGGGLFLESHPFIGFAPLVTDTLVAHNSAPTGPDCWGPIESGYDLVGNGDGCAGPSAANHDLVGALLSPVDPKLGDLTDNGGATFTHALLPGSPAIDAGNPATPGSSEVACAPEDQRGVARPFGVRCDIGAFEATPCVAGGKALCLSAGRFRITGTWATDQGTGPAHTVTLTADSGYLWFFSPDNVEVTIKVLDACSFNQRFWVFASGITNVRVDLTVTDTKTGTVKTYTNPINHPFAPILDTSAFATCP